MSALWRDVCKFRRLRCALPRGFRSVALSPLPLPFLLSPYWMLRLETRETESARALFGMCHAFADVPVEEEEEEEEEEGLFRRRRV